MLSEEIADRMPATRPTAEGLPVGVMSMVFLRECRQVFVYFVYFVVSILAVAGDAVFGYLARPLAMARRQERARSRQRTVTTSSKIV